MIFILRDGQWIDLSLFRSDREAGVVDLVTVWVGSRGRQARNDGSRREGVSSFFFCRAGTTPMINRVKGYGEEARGKRKREMGV